MSPTGQSRAAARLRAPDPRWAPLRPAEQNRVAVLVEALKLPAPLCAILAARGIDDGDWVAIATPLGQVRARAALDVNLDPQVVVGQHLVAGRLLA